MSSILYTVSLRMSLIYLHTKFYINDSSGLLVIVVELKPLCECERLGESCRRTCFTDVLEKLLYRLGDVSQNLLTAGLNSVSCKFSGNQLCVARDPI
jgi:hypothetical protein